jgi:hypothetical protein
MTGATTKFTILWLKLIGSVVVMLGALAMVVWYTFGVTFDSFWSQMALYFIAMFVGLTGVMFAFRTKLTVIR